MKFRRHKLIYYIIMSTKVEKKNSQGNATEKSSTILEDGTENSFNEDNINLSLVLNGGHDVTDWVFLVVFRGRVILETKWSHLHYIPSITLPLDLKDSDNQYLVADNPLVLLLRSQSGKAVKEQDPFLNPENKAGATVDLFPLVLGDTEISLTVPLTSIFDGSRTDFKVAIYAKCNYDINLKINTVPLMLTLLSAHCLPSTKDGTVYVAAIDVTNTENMPAVNFGMSLSSSEATKIMWATASNASHAANTCYDVPTEIMFIPTDCHPDGNEQCKTVYWNAMKRTLIDLTELKNRLTSYFLFEIAGVPRTGKIDIRGRYIALVDAGVLLEANQFGVTVCAKILPFNESYFVERVGPLLELPPTSAKASAKEQCTVFDDYGHIPYIVIRFDLHEALTPSRKTLSYFETLGIFSPKTSTPPTFELEPTRASESSALFDKKWLAHEVGALSVHEELNYIASTGTAPISQSLKRTAANNLLVHIRSVLKKHAIEKNDDWQDVVTARHKAILRNVLASFEPILPKPPLPSRTAVAKSRLGGDIRIAQEYIRNSLNISPDHPRVLFCKALRDTEARDETQARNFILKALCSQPRNRYLLWTLGGIDSDKYEQIDKVNAAFNIAVKGDRSDALLGVIGWGALHAFHHYWENSYGAFIAEKNLRKYFGLEKPWDKFIEKWTKISGEEEIFWDPKKISIDDPLVLTSAFFLCLRCFKFSDMLLRCYEKGCSTRVSNSSGSPTLTTDVCYLRVTSLILRQRINEALSLVDGEIKKFGPSSALVQIRATCLALRGWNADCDNALMEVDRFGIMPSSYLLYHAALGKIKTNPERALQYAARAHKIIPSAYTALLIGRIFATIGEEELAERWAAVAVDTEPILADGWGFLAILAMNKRNIPKARALLRTSKQVGPLSADLENDLRKTMKIMKIESFIDAMSKDVCFCDYY